MRAAPQSKPPPRDPVSIHATRWRWGGRWDPSSAGVSLAHAVAGEQHAGTRLHECCLLSRKGTPWALRGMQLLIDHTRQVCLIECFNHKGHLVGTSPPPGRNSPKAPSHSHAHPRVPFHSHAHSLRLLPPAGGAAHAILSLPPRGAHMLASGRRRHSPRGNPPRADV